MINTASWHRQVDLTGVCLNASVWRSITHFLFLWIIWWLSDSQLFSAASVKENLMTDWSSSSLHWRQRISTLIIQRFEGRSSLFPLNKDCCWFSDAPPVPMFWSSCYEIKIYPATESDLWPPECFLWAVETSLLDCFIPVSASNLQVTCRRTWPQSVHLGYVTSFLWAGWNVAPPVGRSGKDGSGIFMCRAFKSSEVKCICRCNSCTPLTLLHWMIQTIQQNQREQVNPPQNLPTLPTMHHDCQKLGRRFRCVTDDEHVMIDELVCTELYLQKHFKHRINFKFWLNYLMHKSTDAEKSKLLRSPWKQQESPLSMVLKQTDSTKSPGAGTFHLIWLKLRIYYMNDKT